MVKLRIRAIAQDLKMSQGQLSRRANLTPAVIRRLWDDPHHNAELRTLEKIARALGVRICDLIEEEGDREAH